MSCDCTVPAASDQTTRKARKRHACDECGDPIFPGERYVYVSGIWDRYPQSFHFHAACDSWRRGLEDYIRWAAAMERVATYEAYRTGVSTYAEALRRQKFAGLCDCIAYGQLGEAMAEFSREVLGYEADGRGPRTWGAI